MEDFNKKIKLQKADFVVGNCIKEINRVRNNTNEKVVYLPLISIKTATALKDLGYKLSPRKFDKNEEIYYKVYLTWI